jgi:hypothetical protein
MTAFDPKRTFLVRNRDAKFGAARPIVDVSAKLQVRRIEAA